MGVVTNTKEYIQQRMIPVGRAIGDGIAHVASFSPKQINEAEEKRIRYLQSMPDMESDKTKNVIQSNMGAIAVEVYQAYFEQLKTVYEPICFGSERFDSDNRIRSFDITKWVVDKEEKSLDKLINVYHVLSEEECNIALIYNRNRESCRVTLGIVNNNFSADPAIADNYQERIAGALKGNFPGTCFEDAQCGIPKVFPEIANELGQTKSVAVVSNIASEKSESFISQSIEKLLDGFVPENEGQEYAVVLLAKPVKDQLERKNRLYDMYSRLAPYAEWENQYTYMESEGLSASATLGANINVSTGAHATGNVTTGTGHSHSVSSGSNSSAGLSLTPFGIGGSISGGSSSSTTDTYSAFESSGISSGVSAALNFGASFSRSAGVAVQSGKNEGVNLKQINFAIKHTLEIIESQIKRIEESSALGMWEFAAYVVSDSSIVANNVAHMYLALTQGESSYVTKTNVNLWDGSREYQHSYAILSNIYRLQHPVFARRLSYENEWLMYPTLITPTTALSGKELSRALNFPRKSVGGLPVLEMASFGREIIKLNNTPDDEDKRINIGRVYHMGLEENNPVYFDMNSLNTHTFVTGSTGSGKSNMVYQLLDELKRHKIPWLVIEPAKGEYKDAFGGMSDVATYGTNPFKVPNLLKVNPFSFPADVHVLEHIDRLVEVFNACWPMYAAMPAILREAIERAYEECGWNLNLSRGIGVYPDFSTLLEILPVVIDSSAYSADTTSDYKGALVTRIRSLTRGIHGMVFSGDISADELFSRNAIVDLSRIGSQETKSLIMGILVLKLQEYRMSEGNQPNMMLRHVTVLEEAHNLLRKTSSEQSQESSNIAGQAVVMLSNAIAEMRTYGEGFVIVDQSPGLMDMSVVRNTNTKIIMRLPDEGDRELVGRAAGLNDAQIEELPGLEMGVAAAFQSDWVEPVLVKVAKFENMQPLKKRYGTEDFEWYDKEPEAVRKFLRKAMDVEQEQLSAEDKDILRKWYKRLGLSVKAQYVFDEILNGKMLNEEAQLLVILGVAGQRASAMPSKEAMIHEIDSIFIGRYGIDSESDVIRETHYIIRNFLPDIFGQDRKAGVVL